MYGKIVNLPKIQQKIFKHTDMKNMILGIAAALSAACTPVLKVDVANTTQIERDDETVEIAWSEVAALEGATSSS